MRAISWTRTAQTGTLQVKQYDYTAERHIVVLLNTEGAEEKQLEECLRLTRSVCEKLEQRKTAINAAVLEAKLAAFKDVEAVLVFNCGVSANSALIPVLVGKGDII